MNDLGMRGPLGAFKARFHDEALEAVARIANTRWKLEFLQRRCGDILPSSDAAKFVETIQPMLQSLDTAKQKLLEANSKADDIIVIGRGGSANERY